MPTPTDENTRAITILLAVDVSSRFTWAAICASRHEENVAKAMANIITQKDRAAANLRVLTGDLSKGTTVKYSGDDDHTLWAGVRNQLAKYRQDLGYGDGEVEAFAQDNNIPYAQAASNGINEATGRTIGTIWRAIIMQSRHIYENSYLMTHAYLHAVTLSNVLPKRDENGDDYTPYNRLSGGMANADLFYPFGTIGYFVDPTKSKLAPDRRVPCLYLGTEIEIPHALDAETGLPAHHQYQYKVIEWRRLMNSTDIPEPRRTIHAVFMNQEVMPADVTSAFKKYEADLTFRLTPIDNALRAPGEQLHVPRQPTAGARPPPRRTDDGSTRSSRRLEESVQPAPTRGGVNNKVMTRDELEEEEEVDDGFARLRAELEKREMEKKKKMTRGTLSRRGEQRQEPRKGACSYADAVTGNTPGVATRSRAKAKDAFFVGAAQSVEAAKNRCIEVLRR